MRKLKIPQNHSGISKTLRLPENLVNDIQILADIKNISFNKAVSELLEFSLKNLDEEDEKIIEENVKTFLLYINQIFSIQYFVYFHYNFYLSMYFYYLVLIFITFTS